ncbi:MAG: 50S ribosomal protein L10 [Prevotellaceae bacterium]|jgi:large subunit ribosomal protein L10|nr:50S ribosomal protein L10 [Prevotellaceae bacterium]
MRKEEKNALVDGLISELNKAPNFYVTDISGLNAENTSKLRRLCFEKSIKLIVTKNTLLKKALEQKDFPETDLYSILQGPTSVMITETPNAPAKLIEEFGKKHGKPLLKGAYVQECLFIGENNLDALIHIKSREELIGEIVGMLQSPARNVISALQSAGGKLAGIVKTLSEKSE